MNTSTIRSLIIDDDPFIREMLSDKLKHYAPEVKILSTATSGAEGLVEINAHKPDLIFLDVEMSDMTGFEMLENIKPIEFQTIFITSYSHYAIKAIRFNALDYLLKPIDLGELKAAIERFKTESRHQPRIENLNLALHNLHEVDVSAHQLVLQTQQGEMRLAVNDIIRIEGERNYSYIYLRQGKKKLVAKTLANLEERMEGKGFFRCHRSYLVNNKHIEKIRASIAVCMSDGVEVPISRRNKTEFIRWFENS